MCRVEYKRGGGQNLISGGAMQQAGGEMQLWMKTLGERGRGQVAQVMSGSGSTDLYLNHGLPNLMKLCETPTRAG